jgi:micrococcal nuclease
MKHRRLHNGIMGICFCLPQEVKRRPTISHVTPDVEAIYGNCNDSNTPYITYDHIKKMVKILRIVDGDTVDIAMAGDDKRVFKYRVRLYGIDTPEKRPPKTNADRDKEIEASRASKDALMGMFQKSGNYVTVQLYKPDKYGRLLGTFYDRNGVDVNQWMIEQGHAVAYFGKTKKSFAEIHSLEDIKLDE